MNNQCVDRESVWGEPQALEQDSLYLQISDANNQGRQCAIKMADTSCAPEEPIQNLDEVGNPISCANGLKRQTEVDYRSPIGRFMVARTYFNEPEFPEPEQLKLKNGDDVPEGLQFLDLNFHENDTDAWLFNIPQLLDYGYGWRIFKNGMGARSAFHNLNPLNALSGELENENGKFIHTSVAGTVHTFDEDGQIDRIDYRGGEWLDYIWSIPGLLEVRDNYSRRQYIYYRMSSNTGGEKEFVVTSFLDPAKKFVRYQYNSNDMLTQVEYQDGSTKQYTYADTDDDTSNLIAHRDELGIIYAQWSYDEDNRGTLSKHYGDVEKVTIAYHEVPEEEGPNLRRSTVTRQRDGVNALETDYEFVKINGAFKPIKITNKECDDCLVGVTLFEYDSNGFLKEIGSPNGRKTTYGYNGRGLLQSKVEANFAPEARGISIVWHPVYAVPTSVSGLGITTTYTHDSKGNVLTQTSMGQNTGTSRTLTYTYNIAGQVLTVDGPRTDVDDITKFEYNNNGNLTKVTNALGHETRITAHDAYGRPTTVVDANGATTTMSYSPRGWLLSTSINGDTTEYDYDAAGKLTKVTSPNGVELHYEYDGAARLTAITDGLGNRIEYTLDLAGNRPRTELKDPSGVVKSHVDQVFNNLSQLTQSIGANQQTHQWRYDLDGNLSESVDALGHTSVNHLDALNRVTRSVAPGDTQSQFEYDDNDLVTKVIDATGRETRYSRNSFGEVIRQESPDTGITTYTYDIAGNQLSKTDARGITINYAYDALNRVTSISYPDAAENVIFSYDDVESGNKGIGRLTGVTEQNGGTAYRYNVKGELVEQINSILVAGVVRTFTTEYAYDAAGLVTQVTYPSGRVIGYQRNLAGQITGVTSSVDAANQTLVSGVQYLPFGPISQLTYGNGKTLVNNYDQSYRLVQKQVTGVTDLSYSHTARNNISAITNALNASQSQSFAYDALARLITANGEYGNQTYSFDNVGNRLTKTQGSDTTGYGYSPSLQLNTVTQADNSVLSFTYDAAGNTLTKGELTFTYNQAGRMVTASKEGLNASYLVNAHGERVSKTVNGVTTLFIYDRASQLIAEADEQGNITTEYVYLDNQRLATIKGQDTYYVHTNHLDAPIALTDQQGTIQWQASYEPYGGITLQLDNVSQKHAFPGQYTDDETGLSYNLFRDYDPEIGRYLTSDPIGLSDGPNTYAYVGANPVNRTDSTGLFVDSVTSSCIRNPALCAIIGGATLDGGINVAGQIYENGWSCVDWGEAGGAALEGAAIGLAGYGIGLGIAKYGGGLLAGLGRGFGGLADDVSKGARFPINPNKLFPVGYAGLIKTTKLDGKIIYEVKAGGNRYKIEYHPKHGGNDHFDGNHYHAKKQASIPAPGKTRLNWFRMKNRDVDTPAILDGGTFAPGDKLPTTYN